MGQGDLLDEARGQVRDEAAVDDARMIMPITDDEIDTALEIMEAPHSLAGQARRLAAIDNSTTGYAAALRQLRHERSVNAIYDESLRCRIATKTKLIDELEKAFTSLRCKLEEQTKEADHWRIVAQADRSLTRHQRARIDELEAEVSAANERTKERELLILLDGAGVDDFEGFDGTVASGVRALLGQCDKLATELGKKSEELSWFKGMTKERDAIILAEYKAHKDRYTKPDGSNMSEAELLRTILAQRDDLDAVANALAPDGKLRAMAWAYFRHGWAAYYEAPEKGARERTFEALWDEHNVYLTADGFIDTEVR